MNWGLPMWWTDWMRFTIAIAKTAIAVALYCGAWRSKASGFMILDDV